MTTERDDFELVYAEAFPNAVGFFFDPGTDDYQEYVETFVENWLTTPDVTLPFHPKSELTVLEHPYSGAWIREDIEQMAKVAYFGRQLINCARRSLEQNDEWNRLTQDDSLDFNNRVAKFMQSTNWVSAHEGDLDPDRSKDQNVASPLRLLDWPSGRYVNCLGQSIALAAAAELSGEEYLYANELRTSDERIYALHQTVLAEIKKLYPDFFNSGGIVHSSFKYIDKILAIVREDQAAYNDLFFGADSSLTIRGGDDRLREWHHYILCKYGESLGFPSYRQVDPYALTMGFMYADEQGVVESVLSRSENVAIIDTTWTFTDTERAIHDTLHKLRQFVDRNKRITRRCSVEDCMEGSIELCAQMLFDIALLPELSGNAPNQFKDTFMKNIKDSVSDALESYKIEQAIDAETAERLLRYRYGVESCTQEEFNAMVHDTIEQIYRYEAKHKDAASDGRLLYELAPLVVFMRVYSEILRFHWNIKEWGAANPATEVGDPEFMIGAMYLNHYATHRKDGRINVARYLARYSASQVIWQCAQLDGECSEDPSVEAVGAQVAQLPERQQHPRVALTTRTHQA